MFLEEGVLSREEHLWFTTRVLGSCGGVQRLVLGFFVRWRRRTSQHTATIQYTAIPTGERGKQISFRGNFAERCLRTGEKESKGRVVAPVSPVPKTVPGTQQVLNKCLPKK